MIRFLIEPPAAEPVTLSALKAHLRIPHADEDARLASLLAGARAHVETLTGLVLMPQRWRLILDAWPWGNAIEAGFGPLRAIHEARLIDAAGASVTLAEGVLLIRPGPRATVIDIEGSPAPLRIRRGIEIDVDAGFAEGAMPPDLGEAILRLAARWYGERGDEPGARPTGIAALLAPYRQVRL